jgi:hypothetical protein
MTSQKLGREDLMLGGVALLLAISLLLFPWFSISIGPITISSSGTGAPDGWLGVIGMLLAVAVVADLAIERLSPQTQLPAIGGDRPTTRFILAVAAAGCVALKFILHIHFSLFGWGFYLTAIAAGVLVYFTMQARSGEISIPKFAGHGPAAPPAA